jgi:hypothetical protein
LKILKNWHVLLEYVRFKFTTEEGRETAETVKKAKAMYPSLRVVGRGTVVVDPEDMHKYLRLGRMKTYCYCDNSGLCEWCCVKLEKRML